MKKPDRSRYVNRAGIVTVNYTKALEKYIDFLEAENKQLAISGVSNRRELLRDYEKFTDPDQNMKDAEQNISWFLGE